MAAITPAISPSFSMPPHYLLQYLDQVGSLHEFTAWRGRQDKLMIVLEEDPEYHYHSHRSQPTNTYSSFQYRNNRASNRIACDIYKAVMVFLQRVACLFLRRPRLFRSVTYTSSYGRQQTPNHLRLVAFLRVDPSGKPSILGSMTASPSMTSKT